MISGALMGIAGAYLSLAQFNAFTFGVISGRGWVCIALVVLGQWDPWRVAGAALLFGAHTKPALALFSTLAVGLSGLAGWTAGAGLVFALGLILFAAHLAWQIARLDIDDPLSCLAVFKSNRDAGLILFAALVLDAAWHAL